MKAGKKHEQQRVGSAKGKREFRGELESLLASARSALTYGSWTRIRRLKDLARLATSLQARARLWRLSPPPPNAISAATSGDTV